MGVRTTVGAMVVGAVGIAAVARAVSDRNDAQVPESDHAAARAAAERTIASIDWSRPNLAIWAAGTEVQDVRWQLRNGLEQAAGGADRVSIAQLAYPASAVDMASSVAVGKEALSIVLAEVRRRDPDGSRYHVALTGESQGAWVIQDVLAVDDDESVVDRVALYGVPRIATHDGALDDDPRARVSNHRWDPITWPLLGSANAAAEAGAVVFGGAASSLLPAVEHVMSNPVHAAVFGAATLRLALGGERASHPHMYEQEMGDGARFLLDGA